MKKRNSTFLYGLAAGVVVIAVLHLTAVFEGWYYSVRGIDIPMHIACGMWLAGLFVYLFILRRDLFRERPFFTMVLFVLGFAAFVGVCWELWEFAGTKLFPQPAGPFDDQAFRHYLIDTMKDLGDDLIGGAIGFLVLWRRYIRKP